jgi:hypothetical protein
MGYNAGIATLAIDNDVDRLVLTVQQQYFVATIPEPPITSAPSRIVYHVGHGWVCIQDLKVRQLPDPVLLKTRGGHGHHQDLVGLDP